ncbi:nuclear pore complex protein NUP160-like isoform X2 [Arachis hypogaea]|uniref:nuclear pore complex protein NUP160-like isoform X2 n=1 Tax=Arachis hypogaea TaxID=3818 RepID=UPI000DEC15E6|nr:nuclear pore complex protein NUP160-like isoform X2 [Arachis hypogaea]XP_025663882.1 nuclear pore complex protein NUP160-like isoform X2 [Arachis hypogaea]QHO26096.1 Nuclear pore complex protein [Arachis hypogaea]
MGTDSTLAGKEVPIIGTDVFRWIELSVPSSSSNIPTAVDGTNATTIAPPTVDDRASCFVLEDPSAYLIWRIHKLQPHALELLELNASKELPKAGLRFIFPYQLCPFAFVCKNEISRNSRFPYLLYVLTVTGVAYLLKIRNVSAYASSALFPAEDLFELNVCDYVSNHVPITAVTATAGCVVVGRSDGSVCCFRLGVIDTSAPGFVHELRDEAGVSRLWGLMSRGKMVGAVQDMEISELHGKRFVFVLHSDGTLRIWDLSSHSRVFNHTVTGATFRRLWVGQFDPDSSTIPLSILYKHGLDEELEMISLHSIRYNFGERNVFSMDPSVQNITLEEGQCLDVKITLDKIWILKDDELVSHMLTTNVEEVEAFSYALQEEVVADQLFQSSEHQADEILQIACSIFSSSKEDVVPFISSIFLRKLLLPGVHHNAALHATLAEYSRHLPESDLQALTADGLKQEVLSLIEHEVGSEKLSILHSWKCFLTRYFHNWCKNNAIYGLLVDSSTDAVGLIRKSSVSIFRSLEDIERIVEGSSDEVGELTGLVDLLDDDLECEILVELLRCVMSFSQQLGKTASSIFYESVLTAPVISSEDIVHCIVKILETGSCISGPNEKELIDHKSLRKLSAEMFLSLQSLYRKASAWSRILNVIQGFLKFLVPQKIIQNFDTEVSSNINSSIIVHTTYQISKVMFESAWDFLLFLSYLVDIGGQVHLSHDDITKIQLEIVPMLQEIIFEWLIINFFAITPSAPATTEDFNSKLSSLHIDCNTGKQLWNEKLGRRDFTLAFILLLNVRSSSTDHGHLLKRFPNMQSFVNRMRDFISWIIWGQSGGSSNFLSRSIDLAFILFKHGQYEAAEQLLMMAEAHLLKEKTSQSIQESDGGWCIRQHLLGCCLLAQVQCGLHTTQKDNKVFDAIRCFFRSSSGNGASEALQSLSEDVGIPYLGFSGCASTAAWKLQYYQWAMQLFERYSISEGACQFALAALEQVDEAMKDENNPVNGSITTTRGRLWANVFIFALDLGRYYDAYCAIVSNPDEESKYICLRRFIIVLYEQGAIKILCSNKLPLIGLVEKVEQELAWKAERSDISAKPNLYKLLYAFQMHQHNWRRAANYMYMYSTRLRTEAASKDYQGSSLMLQERLNALSAAINSLHLVHPAYAWIDPPANGSSLLGEHYPSKKAKRIPEDHSDNDAEPERWQSCIDVEKLENEFVLTSAEYKLSLVNVKWTFSGKDGALSDLAELLVNNNLYDMAFTILLRFFKGSALKRELERVLSAISLRCCLDKVESTWVEEHGQLVTSSKLEMVVHGSPVTHHTTPQTDGSSCWATLKIYLEKYKEFHGRLPVIVAETLLRADPQIELPLWLVQLFKEGQKERMSGMSGRESNPASLFQLYVSYGRYTEATNLLLECIQSFASVRPADIIRRKRSFAAWFPYTTIERLLYQLEELTRKGHMVEQCDKLKRMLLSSLQNHLKTLKVDSEDAISVSS